MGSSFRSGVLISVLTILSAIPAQAGVLGARTVPGSALGPFADPNLTINPATTADAISISQTAQQAAYDAYVNFGHMGMDLSISSTCNASTCSGYNLMALQLTTQDTLSFTGVTDGWLELQYRIEGAMFTNPSTDPAFAMIFFDTNVGSGGSPGGIETACHTVNGCTVFGAPDGGSGNFSVDGSTYVLSGTMFIQISGGTAAVNTTLDGFVQTFNVLNFTSSGSLQFLHTALIGNGVVLDNNRNVVPAATIASQSGYDYTQSITAASAPEPSTWLLPGAGLAAFLARKYANRRQRQRHQS